MISLKNIYKSYSSDSGQITALHDINLTVEKGQIYGVIGRSGAGKSTLIRCVNLLERPSSGFVEVNGQELTGLSDAELRQARHRMGMVFQHFNLLATRTVYENVALPLELLKKSKQEIDKIVRPLLELTGLSHRATAYPSRLSGGQKQRVAIARALSTQPTVLLCDEMTSALDPETTASILELVKNINEQMQLSILLITHEMGVIKSIADRVAVLDDGRIIEEADVVTLFKSPKTEIAKTFTGLAAHRELPPLLKEHLHAEHLPGDQTVIRMTFSGDAAAQPVIDDLIRHFKVRINIMQANLEFLRSDTLGMMIFAISGEGREIASALQFLIEKKLTVEVLGYVATDAWSFS